MTEEHAWRQRFAAVRRASADSGRDDDYEELTAAWDEAGEDGLADA